MNRNACRRSCHTLSGLFAAACAALGALAPAGRASAQWTFQRSIGAGPNDIAYSIEQCSDGGYVTCGVRISNQNTNADILVDRYNSDGSLVWDRVIGNSAPNDIGHCIRQTSDGGFIVAAETAQQNNFGIGLVKLFSFGGIQWSRLYQGTAFIGGRIGVAVREVSDGGFAVVGRVRNQGESGMGAVLFRTDSNGNPIFGRRYNNPAFGGNDTMSFADLRVLSDGFVIVGHDASSSTALRDMLLCKISLTGAPVWAMVYGDPNFDEESDSLENTSDGGFALSARDSSIASPGGTRFVKTDAAGTEITSRRFASLLSAQSALREDIHGKLIFGGNLAFTTSGNTVASLARTFADGTLDIAMGYGAFSPPGSETGEAAIPTSDCGYALAGRTDHFPVVGNSEQYVVKTNKFLSSGCNETAYTWPDDKRLLPSHSVQLTFSNLSVSGWTPNNNSGTQSRVLCLNRLCLADFNGDGFVTADDFDLFTNAFDAGDISADVNCDGFTTADDFDAYTNAFDAGC